MNARLRVYLNSWRFWNGVAFVGIVAAMIVGFYAIAQQNRQAEKSRDDLCRSVNHTRSAIRRILVLSETQAVAHDLNNESLIHAYYVPLIALVQPVDCSDVVS